MPVNPLLPVNRLDGLVRKIPGYELDPVRALGRGHRRPEAFAPVLRVCGGRFFSCESPTATRRRRISRSASKKPRTMIDSRSIENVHDRDGFGISGLARPSTSSLPPFQPCLLQLVPDQPSTFLCPATIRPTMEAKFFSFADRRSFNRFWLMKLL